MTATGVDAQIAQWRAFVSRAPAVGEHDVDELEGHLRDQIVDLGTAGLADDEAFLVAVKRLGDVDALSREFAQEHSGRLWKQLVLGGADEDVVRAGGWIEALVLALAAAVVMQIARLAVGGGFDDGFGWLGRDLGLLVLPFVAALFARRRELDARRCLVTAAPFALAALLVNAYPYGDDSASEVVVALHLPVALWFVVGYAYTSGRPGSHERRMDFVRFTGEWVVYYALIALGGGVLLSLTALVFEPIHDGLGGQVVEWALPSGAAGAVVVAAWLVESKQHVVENMAPVLTALFTPLFTVMLVAAVVVYAVSGAATDFDREMLGGFDALLIVVLGLVLYSMSAREATGPPGLADRLQTIAVGAALVLDLIVLGTMTARIGDLGLTPNRVAALGLNLLLLVNLAGAGWLSVRFLMGRIAFHRMERWQTSYLAVFAAWVALVVAAVPPLFSFG